MSPAVSRQVVREDPWHSLRSFTKARIALGKTGVSLPLKEVLEFKLAHAFARDAVFSELKITELQNALNDFNLPVYLLHSVAANRAEYLQRPDYGKKLNEDSVNKLQEQKYPPADIAIVLADGLSAAAVNIHAIPLLKQMIELFKKRGYSMAPVTLVEQGRVAIADETGYLLNATLSIILIGERPGLTTAESLGAYITYHPEPGLTDETRNCVSNIHIHGMSYRVAAEKIAYLAGAAMELKLSGVNLKDDSRLLL